MVQETPEFVDVQIPFPPATATRWVPSELEAMEFHGSPFVAASPVCVDWSTQTEATIVKVATEEVADPNVTSK